MGLPGSKGKFIGDGIGEVVPDFLDKVFPICVLALGTGIFRTDHHGVNACPFCQIGKILLGFGIGMEPFFPVVELNTLNLGQSGLVRETHTAHSSTVQGSQAGLQDHADAIVMKPLGHVDDFGFTGRELKIKKDLSGEIMLLADIHVQGGPVDAHFPHEGRLLFYFFLEIIAALRHKTKIGTADQLVKQRMIFKPFGNSNLLHEMTLLMFQFGMPSLYLRRAER